MTSSEEISIEFVWSDFQNNLTESVQMLQVSEKFCDVTLVCEDGEHVSAHRAVLAAGSTVLRNLLKKTAEQPDDLVFLTSVTREEVETLLHWLYTGQVQLERDGLASFLGLAGHLAVQGVTHATQPTLVAREVEETNIPDKLLESFPVDPNQKQENVTGGKPCPYCNMLIKKGNLGRHINRKHINIFRLICSTCNATFDNRNSLKTHMDVCKGNLKLYPISCEECFDRFENYKKYKNHKRNSMCKKNLKFRKSCPICFKAFFKKHHLQTHLNAFHPANDSALVAVKEEAEKVTKKENILNKEVNYNNSTAKNVISDIIESMGVDKVIELINTI